MHVSPAYTPQNVADMYQTASAEIGRAHRRAGSVGSVQRGSVPTVSEVMARKPRVRRPLAAAEIDMAGYPALRQREEDLKRAQGDPVLYAPMLPVRFPAKDTGLTYPAPCRQGADNPLYRTTSTKIGEEPPANHQIHDEWFPKGQSFTSSFTESAPRDTSFWTHPTRSKIHAALESPF
eukprot:gnl/TRDRNA2_/TRDRNA2_41670_c0_seq1.p2 gnl/TRDRNA2_/TRDRNA2_41670_c0~~gnl/TRDRNA2_/TRDRNA2_41670_c0_seq1.p2  ORF type:complete len:178 (+),score=21.08 gnl/TRDRNA2_/TRDRNA2_41670_c0_seq1:131-664(+)